MFPLKEFLLFLLYGPYQKLVIFTISFICLLYLYLGILNFLISKAIFTYNIKCGLLINFKTEWTITKVMGLYPPDWKPQKVIPEMDYFMLRMIYDHPTFYYFFFLSFLIIIYIFILFICKEFLNEKVYETKNPLIILLKNKKIVLLIHIVLFVLCFFYGWAALTNHLNIMQICAHNMSSGLALSFCFGPKGTYLEVIFPK